MEKFWEVEVRAVNAPEAVFTAAKSEAEAREVGAAYAAKIAERNPKSEVKVEVRPLTL